MSQNRRVCIVHREYDKGQRGIDDNEVVDDARLADAAQGAADELRARGKEVFAVQGNIIASEDGIYAAFYDDDLTDVREDEDVIRCECCGRSFVESHVHVAASPIAAASFAYCRQCLQNRAVIAPLLTQIADDPEAVDQDFLDSSTVWDGSEYVDARRAWELGEDYTRFNPDAEPARGSEVDDNGDGEIDDTIDPQLPF
jgi:hypothetical protein